MTEDIQNSFTATKIKQSAIPQDSIDNIDSKKQLEQGNVSDISFFSLFRFASALDIILIIIGSISAAAMGVALPAFALLWGNMTDSFGSDGDKMVQSSKQTMFQFLYIGAAAFVASWLMFACWMIAGQRQAIVCRKQYLKSLLKQQIGWFDNINQSQLASKFATDTFAFQGAIGQKIATLIMTIAMLIAGFVIAFLKGWLMSLVVMATVPALAVAGFLYVFVISNKDKKLQKDYAQAGGKAQQAISAIKTVKQLNGQLYESQQYQKSLTKASSNIWKYGLLSGAGIGSIFFVMLASYALGFWWGSQLVQRKQPNAVSSSGAYKTGDVLVIFFSILMAGFNLSQLTPAFEKIAQGKQAGSRIFSILDRQPLIKNPMNPKIISNLKGLIKFQNVTFSYPKDKSRKILNNLNLQLDCNSNSIVGQSGCGKSTVLQLIMRFYDPDQGSITLDGINLKQIDLFWLRQNIGYVGQQPVLFATSIKQNLLFGKQNATNKQIDQALKKAQAYDFIQHLENKMDTYVGYGGGQLSGGQKQRIAIARAILKNPKILLLDQATSALDRRNQRLIQKTLDLVSQGRTSITVAHRVKTIMHSNQIYVLHKGQVFEKGKFTELARYRGIKIQQDIIEEQRKQNDIQQIKLRKPSRAGTQLANDIPLTKEELQKKQQSEITKKYQDQIYGRLFKYNSDRMPLFILGILIALANGMIFPVFSIFLSKMLTILFDLQTNPTAQARSNANLYALIFFILGIAGFFTNFFQIAIFNVVGDNITKKLRIESYQKILKMPVAWFDIPRNNAGTLTARLSTDCQIVNGLTTTYIAITIQNIASLVAGITIAFIFQWRTALVALGLIPLMIVAGAIQMAFNTGFSDKTDAAYKDSSNLIMEAMINIRTVTSFGYQSIISTKYSQRLQQPYSLAIRKGNISGFFFGLSQFIMFVVFALIFFLGTIFIRDNANVTINDVFTAIYAIMFSAMTAGNNSHFMPDVAAASNAAANLFLIQDSQDQQQLQIKQNSKLLKGGCCGDIQLKNISFQYQSRKIQVFKNFSLKIKSGSKVALVGTSGCGKSTVMQLLLRFYQPSQGQITINGINIKDFDIHYLRSRFGVVSQQPVLFNGSFKDNIRYNLSQVRMEQIVQAATKSNAISFITGNQQLEEEKNIKSQNLINKQTQKQRQIQLIQIGKTGFDRSVGVKGSHISGGQKQRIAIARAILRNPQMLLLDQATSALDDINQKKVQQSLDKIMKDKTTINIAHRLQTIHNSDQIFVFEKGKIAQRGNYQSLMNLKGYYYNLEKGTQFV